MITKEVARKIYNCYTEIEQGEKMIETLKESINEQGEYELKEDWTGHKRGLNLNIPSGNSTGSYSVHEVPLKVGLDTIKIHIENQKTELKKLKEICETLLS